MLTVLNCDLEYFKVKFICKAFSKYEFGFKMLNIII